LLFGRIGEGVFASSALIFSALSTQLLKHLVNAPRPLTWFAANMPEIELPLVEGVRMNYWYSFPSGHTTSFFALFFVLSSIITSRVTNDHQRRLGIFLQCIFFLLAALGGYSRIYLSQHFALDVFAGALVGVLITIVCYAIFRRYEDKGWYNYRVVKVRG
jgi:membrane-associated phospholipid phosphatase